MTRQPRWCLRLRPPEVGPCTEQVLIATDAAGRVLELLLALERAWGGGRMPYPLALLGGAARQAVETAKSQLQWLADGLQRAFEGERDNPNPFSLQ